MTLTERRIDMEALVIISAIVELIQKYGVPAAMRVINDWHVEDPTPEDFKALIDRLPEDPEDYFK